MATSHVRSELNARAMFVSFFTLVAAASIVACGGGHNAPLIAAQARHPGLVVHRAPSGVYWGAHVNPSGSPATWAEQEVETEALETDPRISRRLALHNLYRKWSDLASITSNQADQEIYGDITYGRVPVIALQCFDNIGNANYGLNEIAAGRADNDLAAIKTALSNLTYPSGPNQGKSYPIILRWFWEFNLNVGNPAGNPNLNNGCFEGDPSLAPQQFINAWDHIRSVLDPGTHIPDITFMWNPTVSIAQSDVTPPPVLPDAYWPGNTQVDWIAVDGYSKYASKSAPNPNSFNQVFDTFFQDFSKPQWGGLPISITETGACLEYSGQYDQASYLNTAETQIDTATSPPYKTATGAFLYFDAPGQYVLPDSTRCHWYFGAPGIQQFGMMGADPNFAPSASQ